MRPGFVIVLLLAAVVIAGGAVWLKHSLASVAPPEPPAVAAVPEPPQKNVPADLPPLPPPAPAPVPVAPVLTPDQQAEAVEAEVERLRAAGMGDDPTNLQIIITALGSPEKEVREAAANAAKQFGSTNAIPALLTAATNAVDPKEKIELAEAAEFVALPSITFNTNPPTPEQIQANQQRAAQLRADRQARLQQRLHRQNQNTQPAVDPNAAPADGNPQP
jgi:HEAT repeats